jgi:capsular polysaccharide biosynthesis protein
MTDSPLDVRASFAIVRRGWRVIAVLAVLGLLGGAALGLRGASRPSASALVLLPPQSPNAAGAVSNDLKTQLVIATSTPVVTPAIKSLTPPVAGPQLQELKVSVATVSDNIFRIRVQAPQNGQALQLADAVANHYIQYVGKYKLMSGTPVQLGPASIALPSSTAKRVMTSGIMGLVAGAFVGGIIVMVRSRRDVRLRRRGDISAAIGVPVLGAIEVEQNKSISEWTRFLEHFEPSPTAAWNLRRVLYHLLPDEFQGKLTIRVACFAHDRAAFAAGPLLAMAASDLDLPTHLDPGMHEALAPLRAACAHAGRLGRADPISALGTPDQDLGKWTWDGRVGKNRQLVISLLALERSQPEWPPFVGPSVLSVSAGFAVPDDLARLALAAAEGGRELEGILLINPEPGDGSAGVLPGRNEGAPSGQVFADHPGNGAKVVGGQR